MNCKYCRANCAGAKQDREIALCLGYDPPKTNADRIRRMTDEELAEWLLSQGCKAHNTDEWCKKQRNCQACWLAWLKQEAKDEQEN